MATLTIDLCMSHAQCLRETTRRDNVSPEEALLAHVKEWLESAVPDVHEPGVIPAPPGMFPDDGCEYSFFDPAMADHSRAKDLLTPKQRLNAIAGILVTIALRVINQLKTITLSRPSDAFYRSA